MDSDSEPNTASNPSKEEKIIATFLKTIFLYQILTVTSDASISLLLGIFKYFMHLMITLLGIDLLKPIMERFPNSLHNARKMLGLIGDDFIKYVVCSKCNKLYQPSQKVNANKRCNMVHFPNHPNQSGRHPCNNKLYKKIFCMNQGSNLFRPRKTYCYRSIKQTLEMMLTKPSFKKMLHSKIQPSTEHKILTDIYDGNIWKTFVDDQGEPFFSDPRNIGFIMNVDWFQPFKNTEYSLGVIYMAIINLSREERFKWENVIVCGINSTSV